MNKNIRRIFIGDQKDRKNVKFDKKNIQSLERKDKRRRDHLSETLKSGVKFTREDFYMIAMIYQHGSSLNDYKKAVIFSRRSMKLGFEKAKWLYAAAQDRLLIKQGKKQKYGTQYKRKDGIWFLYPVNKSINDRERKKYNVPTLKESFSKLEGLNKG